MLGVPRSTHQYRPISPADEPVLVQRMVELATQYGRYGYRRITALLQQEGFKVNHKRVERLWRREGLKVPRRQPKRKRLWLNDGSCIRLRPAYRDHVWSYDFMQARTREGRSYRLLTILDEYSRECQAIVVGRRLTHNDVIEHLATLFVQRGVPVHLRSDNGTEFTAQAVRTWLMRLGVKTLYIEPGSPWENGYIESFNGKLRDEVLNREIFDTLYEAKVLVERWRNEYNHKRPRISATRPRGRFTTQYGHKANEKYNNEHIDELTNLINGPNFRGRSLIACFQIIISENHCYNIKKSGFPILTYSIAKEKYFFIY